MEGRSLAAGGGSGLGAENHPPGQRRLEGNPPRTRVRFKEATAPHPRPQGQAGPTAPYITRAPPRNHVH